MGPVARARRGPGGAGGRLCRNPRVDPGPAAREGHGMSDSAPGKNPLLSKVTLAKLLTEGCDEKDT